LTLALSIPDQLTNFLVWTAPMLVRPEPLLVLP
jgi:hypothetical protein